MFTNKKTSPKRKILGFLILRQKLNKEAEMPLSKKFLARYKKLNNKAYELSVLHKKNEA